MCKENENSYIPEDDYDYQPKTDTFDQELYEKYVEEMAKEHR